MNERKFGSLVIARTRNCTHFLRIGFVVAGGWFYSYIINQGNKSDKDKFYVSKDVIHFLKDWCNSKCVQFHVYSQICKLFEAF